ncbi:aminotransferase class V-fold PLP-dependent enzyme [Pararhodobacter zhoushanensis]|uniref:Aminotransferase class V-fold PLP-dependent enzyme n=1 Tax=Pararhodobacter zhoushanensis TaxID=2479545 RepID=A0ABT3GT62_9RHOB|nr:aminotransferase class V-fold PLP-dependent enzyme [Pararhodobacter zhoushanensis]MCW1930723.1 aminotransferase class V-fold PLP-dependent enzyme [Pararhodobacter zhoushanensis]
MITDKPGLIEAVRDRFAHIDTCPFEGPRVFFENAGGALRLKSVVETSALYASYPDNQGRPNIASQTLMGAIDKGKADMRQFLNAPTGQVFVGESGTEVLFRLVRTAAVGAQAGGTMLRSTLEHPALGSSMTHWAGVTGRELIEVAHDDATGVVSVEAYKAALRPDIRVASIIHTSPVTGMATDVDAIAAAIRKVAPEAFIIVDGIQHACHGPVDVSRAGIDAYALSPYKMFSRHGYGVGWASDRLTALSHEQIIGNGPTSWELGTRDAGAYATFSDVVAYFDWLGGQFSTSTDRRERLEAAGAAIHAEEAKLLGWLMSGTGNLRGLAEMPGVTLVGGAALEGREGVVSLRLDGWDTLKLVEFLGARGIRVHIRKADQYSGNVLTPLGMPDCVRISFCHYNTEAEVAKLLSAMEEAISARG